ncbi:hypothetical protein [Rhodococcus sp. B50]|uniref:hypothetical protein n=1 Tax=Rhodococcus sp. B50 TaxID=2682847 RepID=UPI001BD477A1|nr:hypothetical protein [Rhodococcus sp. B50]MBS9371566.1 hypothetical protein [Rhodococcus sp. B50]
MPSLHVSVDVDVTACAVKSVGEVQIELGRLGSIYLDPDRAHALIDELQEALRNLAETETHQLHRDEVAIRSAAEFREDR